MNRCEIYDRYFKDNRGFRQMVDSKTCKYAAIEEIGNIVYSKYITNEGVYFYICKAAKIGIDKVISNNFCIKFNIPSMYNGYPVIGMDNFLYETIINACSDLIGNNTLVIDFTDSDLSNIITMDELFSRDLCVFERIECRFPKLDEYKAKPVSVQLMLKWMHISDIKDIMESINFENVKYAQEMAYATQIEEFDFGWIKAHNLLNATRMFGRCRQLKEVRGRIGTKMALEARQMFIRCEILKNIEDAFHSVTLYNAESMFIYCHELVNAGIDNTTEFFNFNGQNPAQYIFYSCHNISNRSVKYTLRAMEIAGLDSDVSMFSGHKGKLMVGLNGVRLNSAYNIFKGIESEILDISGIEFTQVEPESIASMIEVTKDEDVEIPYITVVNSYIKFSELSSGECKVVDIRGLTAKEVKSKINMITALDDCKSKYIVIVDKGWIDK